MNEWIFNIIIALLMGFNTLSWGLCVKDMSGLDISLSTVPILIFNKFFILAIGISFLASMLRYQIFSDMGILKGRFFLTTATAFNVLVAHFILGERMTLLNWFGVGLIFTGVIILGRF